MNTETISLSEREAAKILQISHQTLGNYRRAGKGPKCTLIQGTKKSIVLYKIEDLVLWMKK